MHALNKATVLPLGYFDGLFGMVFGLLLKVIDLDYLQWGQFIITCQKENKELMLISLTENGKRLSLVSLWMSIQGPI